VGLDALGLAADGGLALVAVFLPGDFAFEADATFLATGVLVFFGSATSAEVFLFTAFFAVVVSVALVFFGLLEISPFVLDLALSTFLEADLDFFFAIMSPPSNVKITNSGSLPQAMILMQALPVN
jgi:hypothetical protein